MNYCLNREPNFFKNTKFAVDAFHFMHHTNCNATFNSAWISERDAKINSSLSEQKNLRISILAANFPKMSPRNAFTQLWYLVTRLNRYECRHFASFGTRVNRINGMIARFEEFCHSTLPVDQCPDEIISTVISDECESEWEDDICE